MNANGIRLVERLKTCSEEMRTEIDFLVNGVDHELPEEGEEEYDEVQAFMDIDDRDDAFQRECRKILIDIGYYRVMPQAEIDSTYVSSGKKWDFKRKGIPYTQDHAIISYFHG